jgi:hypothetical protein
MPPVICELVHTTELVHKTYPLLPAASGHDPHHALALSSQFGHGEIVRKIVKLLDATYAVRLLAGQHDEPGVEGDGGPRRRVRVRVADDASGASPVFRFSNDHVSPHERAAAAREMHERRARGQAGAHGAALGSRH